MLTLMLIYKTLKGIVWNSCPRYTVCHHQIALEKGRCIYIVKGQGDQSKEIAFHLYDIS